MLLTYNVEGHKETGRFKQGGKINSFDKKRTVLNNL
jgi:hypothetical protein